MLVALSVLGDRLDRLEARLERIEQRATLGERLARARLVAEAAVLKREGAA